VADRLIHAAAVARDTVQPAKAANFRIFSRLPHPKRTCGGRVVLATFSLRKRNFDGKGGLKAGNFMEATMNGLIYLVGLVVVILAVLSFFGLR
jgi:hypothetical protein